MFDRSQRKFPFVYKKVETCQPSSTVVVHWGLSSVIWLHLLSCQIYHLWWMLWKRIVVSLFSWPSISRADVESVMNSIVSLLLILETDKQEALIESLCEKLVKFREGERPSLRMQLWVLSGLFQEVFQKKKGGGGLFHCKYLISFTLWCRRLSNLFHGMDENTPVRYTVFCSLIKVAATCNAISFIPTDLDQVCSQTLPGS